MSDSPTYASLLTRLFGDSPADRARVVAHLKAHPADADAAKAVIWDRLRDTNRQTQMIAADAVVRVYHDSDAATAIVQNQLHEHETNSEESVRLVRSYSAAVVLKSVSAGWLRLFQSSNETGKPALVMGLADAAPHSESDLEPLLTKIREAIHQQHLRLAAGAAFWRLTWRVNRDWLASLDPAHADLGYPGLRRLLLDVLVEHLGRRPDLAPLVRDLLAGIAQSDCEAGDEVVAQLARIGSRGWGVLIPMLHVPRTVEPFTLPDAVRATILGEAAACPAVLPLVHHHAHAIIAQAAAQGSTNDTVTPAARVLSLLGPTAGMAIPDLLALVIRVPSTGTVVGPTISKLAAGFPNTAAAVMRALDRLRQSSYYGIDHSLAFQSLAYTLAELDPDAAPNLVTHTDVDSRVPDLLLRHSGWKDAAPEVRQRHARILTDACSSPRPEVRIRAAEALQHYRPELPNVWPALVAMLASADEKAAVCILPHFRHLAPVADAVTADLVLLFRETNPAYAARAVVALWRLGRMPAVATDLRAAVEADPERGWGWAVLRGVVDRVSLAHGLLRELSELFTAAPSAIAQKIDSLLNPVESPEDAQITKWIPRPGDPASPSAVDWDGLYQAISGDTAGPQVFVALMCEYGSAGFRNQKIWLIKGHRMLTQTGLAESKGIIERMMDALALPVVSSAERHSAVHNFFTHRSELPPEIVEMLEHRLAWFRWAGLELADAWGLTTEQARDLTQDRVWDTSPRVRDRALRMSRG